MSVLVTLNDLTDGQAPVLLGRSLADFIQGLPELPASIPATQSAAHGDPVDANQLREALSFLDPNGPYPDWRDVVAATGAANCRQARQIAHEWSEGKLDRSGRYSDAPPSRWDGPEAVNKVLDTMPPKDGGIGVGTVEKLARDAGWTGTLAPRPRTDYSEFIRKQNADQSEPKARAKFAPILPRDFGSLPIPSYLIDKFIPAQSIVLLYGPFASFKSFIAADCAASVAAHCLAFNQLRAEQGDTIIFAGEAPFGLVIRMKPWALTRGVDLAGVPIGIVPGIPLAADSEELKAAIAAIKAAGLKPKLIVFDTLARMLAGLDENDARAAGLAIAAAEYLIAEFGCSVILVAHPGKDETKKVRGSYALMAGVDAVWKVSRAKDTLAVTLTCEKMKDADPPADIHLLGKAVAGSLVFSATSADEARRASGQAVGLRREDVAAALVALDAKPSGINAWTGEAGGVPTSTLAKEIARARAAEDRVEPTPREIDVIVMGLNRGAREGGPFEPYVVRWKPRQWAIAPGPVSTGADHG